MSLSELLNPSIGSKYWMNTYHNTVHTQGLQFGTSSLQGYILGAIDTTGTIGLIPSAGTGGVGGVTNTDPTIKVTQTSSGGSSIQDTGFINYTLFGNPPRPLQYVGSTSTSASNILSGIILLNSASTGIFTFPNGLASSLYSAMGSPGTTGISCHCLVENVGLGPWAFSNSDANLFPGFGATIYNLGTGTANSVTNLTFCLSQISPPQFLIF